MNRVNLENSKRPLFRLCQNHLPEFERRKFAVVVDKIRPEAKEIINTAPEPPTHEGNYAHLWKFLGYRTRKTDRLILACALEAEGADQTGLAAALKLCKG